MQKYETIDLGWAKPLARHEDPATSYQAAASMTETASKHAMMIVDALYKNGDMSSTGIAKYLGLERAQVFRRMSELERRGFVYLTGRTIKSPSGRSEREWSFKQGQQ